jgi:hypothetical protein
MIDRWLSLPLPALIVCLAGFYSACALLFVYLSFGRLTGAWVQGFRGVVPPYFAGIVVILGILIGFLSSDVWDRSRRASSAVRSEAANLTSLYDLAAASGLPNADINHAIRAYVSAVIGTEWPSMVRGEASPEAEAAQDGLLKIVAGAESVPDGGPALDRLLLDIALKIRDARNERLNLSADYSGNFKWMSVLLFAVVGQISVAVVHLERARPSIAAIVIFTSGIIIVLGLLASHEHPFTPPLSVSPQPIANILKIVPNG